MKNDKVFRPVLGKERKVLRMNHNEDTIQNAELKEAFDEFDKVDSNEVDNILEICHRMVVERYPQRNYLA